MLETGGVPPYEERMSVLVGEAHGLLLAYETAATTQGDAQRVLRQNLDQVRRWLDRYELHLCQIDHPDLRTMPETIDGEVKSDANDGG